MASKSSEVAKACDVCEQKKSSAMNYHTSRTQYHLEETDRQSSRHKVQLKRETRQQMRFSLSTETMPKDESPRSLITVIVIFFLLSARIRKTRQDKSLLGGSNGRNPTECQRRTPPGLSGFCISKHTAIFQKCSITSG